MKQALKGYPVTDFPQPKQGIEWALIDPRTGLLALSKTPNAYLEAFLEGTVPTQYLTQKILARNNSSEEEPEENEGY